MAHKKGVGSSKNGRDSESKRLGVKKFGGEAVTTGAPWMPLGISIWQARVRRWSLPSRQKSDARYVR